jgi:predicted Fe-S protein YdhL (DUF1289 family)
MSDGGKGSAQRPVQDKEKFDQNWDRIFGGVSSPCVDVCQLDYAAQVCRGCFRTLNEIAAWGYANEDERRRILDNIEERKKHGRSKDATKHG